MPVNQAQLPRGSVGRPGAWLWFVVGGVFLLIPGAVLLYFADLPGLLASAAAYPSFWPLFFWGIILIVVPSIVLVAFGLLAIAFGLRRRRAAWGSQR